MRAQGASEMKNFAFSHSKKLIFFPARSFNEVGKTGKEERKSKNENTRLRGLSIFFDKLRKDQSCLAEEQTTENAISLMKKENKEWRVSLFQSNLRKQI